MCRIYKDTTREKIQTILSPKYIETNGNQNSTFDHHLQSFDMEIKHLMFVQQFEKLC